MEVKELKSKGLKREFSITVSKDDLKDKKIRKLQDIASKAKIDGFRPGKVPTSHIEKLYGQSVMVEVIEEKVSEASQNVLKERDLKAAVKPDVKLDSDMNDIIEKNKDLVFTMNCEVLPEIVITDFSKIKLDKPVSKPQEKDINDALEYLAKQNKSYKEVSEKTKSKDGDQVTIDYVGKIDNIAFEGGTASDANLVLGSKSFIDNFEEQLIGLKQGDNKLVKVKFPENYQSPDLAGKEATFDVNIKKVSKAEESKDSDKDKKKTAADVLLELDGPDADAKQKVVKAKGSKNVNSGIVHVLATFNNTIVTISDKRGNVIGWSTAGKMGFRGSRKSTAYAAQVVSQDACRQAMGHGLKEADVKVKGPGSGRESAVRAVQGIGIDVKSISDVTPIPHNGCRPKKARRV